MCVHPVGFAEHIPRSNCYVRFDVVVTTGVMYGQPLHHQQLVWQTWCPVLLSRMGSYCQVCHCQLSHHPQQAVNKQHSKHRQISSTKRKISTMHGCTIPSQAHSQRCMHCVASAIQARRRFTPLSPFPCSFSCSCPPASSTASMSSRMSRAGCSSITLSVSGAHALMSAGNEIVAGQTEHYQYVAAVLSSVSG